MTTEFNPIDYVQRLESEGVPANQANVHASALASVSAYCTVRQHELLELRKDLVGLQCDVAELKQDFDRRMVQQESHMTGLEERMTGLEERMAGLEERMTRLEERMTRLEERMIKLEVGFSDFRREIDLRFAEMRTYVDGRFKMISWMLGTVIALQLGIFIKIMV